MVKRLFQKKIPIFVLPFLAAAVLFCLAKLYISIANYIPECLFFKYTGWLCPSCGSSRSVNALLHFRILDSLRYNVLPLFAVCFGLAGYVELLLRAFGKRVKIIPRSPAFYIALLCVFCAYWVLRNVFPLF